MPRYCSNIRPCAAWRAWRCRDRLRDRLVRRDAVAGYVPAGQLFFERNRCSASLEPIAAADPAPAARGRAVGGSPASHHPVTMLRSSFSQQVDGWVARHDAPKARACCGTSAYKMPKNSRPSANGPTVSSRWHVAARGTRRVGRWLPAPVAGDAPLGGGRRGPGGTLKTRSSYRQHTLPAKTSSFKAWPSACRPTRAASMQAEKDFWQGRGHRLAVPRSARRVPRRLAQTVVSQLDAEHTRHRCNRHPRPIARRSTTCC